MGHPVRERVYSGYDALCQYGYFAQNGEQAPKRTQSGLLPNRYPFTRLWPADQNPEDV